MNQNKDLYVVYLSWKLSLVARYHLENCSVLAIFGYFYVSSENAFVPD